MCMYVITDSKGSYIRQDCGKYVAVKSAKEAMQWTELSKANNVLHHALSNKLKSGYKVVPIEEKKMESYNSNAEGFSFNIEDDSLEISEWEERLEDIANFANDVQRRFRELNNELSIIDRKISDVEHYIEFKNLDACKGWKCFNLLQKLLRKRRIIKNEREIINRILSYGLNQKNIDKLCKEVLDSKSKIYTPRILPELFSSDNIMDISA